MKIAAIQMLARVGDVEANLQSAKNWTLQALQAGAEMVILPEFFTSAMAFSTEMESALRPAEGKPFQVLQKLAVENNAYVGGSFIAQTGKSVKNRFYLFFPEGGFGWHDKDQPTMWENCYYEGGRDSGVMDTPIGPVGSCLCWEFVRTRTARRLKGKVNLVVGGSCWWSLPKKSLPGFPQSLAARNLEIMKKTPATMARLLGVPVIHAAHAGEFCGKMPLLPGFPYESHLLGETQIVDGSGKILARMGREDGEGFVLADVDLMAPHEPGMEVPSGFWIPDLPWQIRMVWTYQNLHGKLFYHFKTKPGLTQSAP